MMVKMNMKVFIFIPVPSGKVLLVPLLLNPASESPLFHANVDLSSMAISCGVFPSIVLANMSAPASTIWRIQFEFPLTTAQWRGVIPFKSRDETEA
jgi:hypothetical protein